MSPCPRCQSPETRTIPGPHPGGHHARLECAGCGRFLKWLPRPQGPGGGVPADTLALVHPRRRPAPLEGTEAQCRLARTLRARALYHFEKTGRPDLLALVRCVVDATWFIANKGKALGLIRWPAPHQMEPPVATGPCPNCGEPVYGSSVCSDQCADELAAYLIADGPARDRSMRAATRESIEELF